MDNEAKIDSLCKRLIILENYVDYMFGYLYPLQPPDTQSIMNDLRGKWIDTYEKYPLDK